MNALLIRGWSQYWGILVSLLLHAGLLFLPISSQNPATEQTRIMFQFQNSSEKPKPSDPELMSRSPENKQPRQRPALDPELPASRSPELARKPSPQTPDAPSPVQPRTPSSRNPSVSRSRPERKPEQPREPSRVQPTVETTDHPRITEVPPSRTRNQPRTETPPKPSVQPSPTRPDMVPRPEDSSPSRLAQATPVPDPTDETSRPDPPASPDSMARSGNPSRNPQPRPTLNPDRPRQSADPASPSIPDRREASSNPATTPEAPAPETSSNSGPDNPRLVSRSPNQKNSRPRPSHSLEHFQKQDPGGSPSPTQADPGVYLKQIRQRIGAAKQYPETLRQAGIEGEVTLEFRLGSSGQIDTLRCVGCEGTELGSAARRSLRRAAPFSSPPDSVVGRSLRITLIFRLEE